MQHDNIQKSTAYLKNNFYSGDAAVQRLRQKKRRNGIIVTVLVALFVVLCILAGNTPHNYYMKNLFVSEATILQCSSGDDGSDYSVQVQLDNPAQNVSIDSDNTWVSVDKQFYDAHSVGQHIGVLVCDYDVFKERFFGIFGKQGQDYEKDMWSVDSAYDSFAAAQAEYPHQQFTDKATLESKTKLDDGESYFVLSYQGREMTNQVDDNQYSHYKVGDSVPCSFDGYGDFVRITNIG